MAFQIQNISIDNLVPNPDNPRVIKDSKFKKLVKSIKDFPKMLEIRPIVVDSNMVILGGNQRFKACQVAGLKKVPVIEASSLSEAEMKQFIAKDNIGYGEWDFEIINQNWQVDELREWGMDFPYDPEDDFFDLDAENENTEDDIPRASDDDYSSFELVMLHDNKMALLSALRMAKETHGLERMEDAMMVLVENYNTRKK
jgi:hypothetical protein